MSNLPHPQQILLLSQLSGRAGAALTLLAALVSLASGCVHDKVEASPPSDHFWITNGPAVFEASLGFVTNLVPRPRVYQPPPEDLPPEIRRAMLLFLVVQQAELIAQPITNSTFHHFIPGSLNNLIWTNVIAHTNGRTTSVWSERSHPPGWPEKPPRLAWNRKSLIWGMRGMTSLSPCWEGEGNPGQVPVTALTRRHGYARGHDMGPQGFHTRFAGKRVWFLTEDDTVVERKILREIVRTDPIKSLDYTIFLFNEDLPDNIQPMRVAPAKEVFWSNRSRYRFVVGAPAPFYKTEQSGHVSADIPGFTVNTFKGGDSGSPNMLPMPGELVFVSGRSTSGASPEMQADMDELCRLEGLDPKRYQLKWVDLSRFPQYE